MRVGAAISKKREVALKLHLLSLACMLAVAAPMFAEARDLRIENKRAVALTELTITAKDGPTSQTYVLTKDLPAGRVRNSAVPAKSCLFDVKGTFADQSTIAADDMNLCAQKTIRLVK